MLYDLQKTQKDRDGIPQILTDTTTSSRRYLKERAEQLKKQGHQIRIIPQYGPYMSAEEFEDLP